MRQMLNVIPVGPDESQPSRLSVPTKQHIVPTIQGEGIYTGVPSLFLRLYGCNRACERCDTKYTWRDPEKNRMTVSVESVAARIIAHFSGVKANHLVVTGGEPLLQADALVELFDRAAAELKVTIETNGTVFDSMIAEYLSLVSLSPKLGDRNAEPSYGVSESTMRWLTCDGPDKQMKLVVEKDGEFEHALDIFDRLVRHGLIERENCFIQPEWLQHGMDLKPFVQEAFRRGYRVAGQAHKAWGIY